ncbi:helix-turn-helix domain-containing protein [Phascolarctobacterium succinatutens]|uniref:helix-turn-helix domain-containing protein n=1 Tax=Phascolarctobacterium succinatutens TaxID=626940 RepID=UPI003AB81C48
MYEKFAQLLAVHGITANTVAKAAHVNASTFTDWKQGKSQPKLEKLQKIADYFNVPVSYFYDGDTSLSIAERQAQSLGIDADALKKELSLKSLDEQTMYVLKEFQKLDDTQKAAIEAVIKGFLQAKS